MKTIFTIIAMFFLYVNAAFAQTDNLKAVHKLQYEASYDKYQKDLPKMIVQKAKDERKEQKAEKKENRKDPVKKAIVKAEKIRSKSVPKSSISLQLVN